MAVVTQPDRPAGRGKHLARPPVKEAALRHNLPVFQPARLACAQDTVGELAALKPDVLVTAAFGQILKTEVLNMARLGVINLHASLLPHYRGPAPISWAIINGELETGVTTMLADEGIDTGAILLTQKVALSQTETAIELADRLARIGANLVVETLEKLAAGQLTPCPQDESLATYAPLLKKEMAEIDWAKPACQIHNLVRALKPWPGTHTQFRGSTLKILKTSHPDKPRPDEGESKSPGLIIETGDGLMVACGDRGKDRLELIEIQPEGRKMMAAVAWANGARLKAFDRFEHR